MMNRENKYTTQQLREFQALPLERKVGITCARLTEFYTHFDGKVFVSFSGGKDSTVLLHIARKLFPDIKALYLDTGLEYPEIKEFVKSFDNVDIRRPSMSFKKVIETEGYPVVSKEIAQTVRERRANMPYQKRRDEISKKVEQGEIPPPFWYHVRSQWRFLDNAPFKISDRCCKIMKKDVSHKYQKDTGLHPILATLANESLQRKQSWLKNGCNAFDCSNPRSTPMAFWTEQDVLMYIKTKNIPLANVYGEVVYDSSGNLKTTGADRTGCMFCLFGIHHEKEPNRIQRLYFTHRKIYDYILDKLGFREVMEWIGVPYKPVFDLFNYQEDDNGKEETGNNEEEI